MLDLLVWTAVFVVSLLILIKSSDYFTDSAEKIGTYFGMPAFIVGVTIVAFGTSLPELVSSIIAVLKNSSEIVGANVIGSNIANIFLIIGIAAIIAKKLKIYHEIIHVDLPFLVGSSFLFAFLTWDGIFTFTEGLLSLVGILIYIAYTINTHKADREIKEEVQSRSKINLSIKTWIVLIASAFLIYIGAKYMIDSVIALSKLLNMGSEIIAISAVALGTSLPELMVSIAAARKGKAEIAIGNVLGSNIFNVFAVMGIPALFGSLIIPGEILTFGLPMMLASTLLFFFMAQEKEITKWEGYLLLLFYVFFIGKLFSVF
jgi:cation:H+ antiporter